jgi:DNA invertase Pin-like site-specific DNA recombinase
MSRIEADHLAREAIVYVRQSTIDQVMNNVESRRRQYGLVERARQLGWANVSIIDDDLGRSGSGVSRPGFEKLLAAICEGRVGVVVSIEASRLARNGRDWHTLLEFCGLVGTLIADEDGVYDPRLPNDRLLLGMKGTMSEMELTILRQRAHEALKQKARRGELFTSVAIGYTRSKGIGSRRIRTFACARRSPWSSASSPTCRVRGRSIFGSGRRESRCQPSTMDRKADVCSGKRRSTARSFTSSPTPFTPAPTRTAGRPAKRQSRTAESALGAAYWSNGLNGTF